ncbi:HD family phosphohydrolase [Halothermothrix orenii]|uniref:Metal dependent phosphohydrolase n=1 Tax=Halothermothrix orenii (strain H 168 / OCM 544 / DSM 9562) TaxID=373903 RepID=B8CXJ0_HALOH|nr:HDIG domain-containing metalloprotein [Halothermothrix orenii]ACL70009.1 metal dependent phosphohydrolase [Halothermothrix orenii H 168]
MFKLTILKKWYRKSFMYRLLQNSRYRKVFCAILFFLIVSLILTLDLVPSKIDLEAGKVSHSDVEAPRTITFIDEEKTSELKKMKAKSIRIYEEDVSVNKRVKDRIISLFDLFMDKKILKETKYQKLISDIKDKYGPITDTTIKTLYEAPVEDLEELKGISLGLMEEQLQRRILPKDLPEAKDELAEKALELDLSKKYRLALVNILETFVEPNMKLDVEQTQKRRQEVMEQVEPETITVRKGEIIVRKGDVVTKDDIKALEALGLQKPQVNYLGIVGVIITIIILMVLVGLYLNYYKPEIWNDHKKVVFLELMVIIILVMGKIIDLFQKDYLLYTVPVAVASILTTILISTDIAIILTIFISFLVGILFDFNFSLAVIGFISGLVGIYSTSKITQRGDLNRAALNIGAVMAITVLGLSFNRSFYTWMEVIRPVGAGILNGFLVAIFANGLLPFLENSFDLTSSVRLLELANPSQPLLKKLLVNAQGSYNHSLLVGNLAETAADNIGADSLLARVGAYYHDIGKIKRPYFFADNQFGGENPHDKLKPNLSALIIKSHVKDGVELARKYKLPKPIIDIIEQHHGTNLISYFYQEALSDDKHDNIKESDFRYDGPKPQSKEAAIIMLADIVEAAVRSKNFKKSNHNRIEGLVREMIKEKLIEGQLDECDLTLKDLDVIARSFVKVLTGVYHHRVEYPENLLKEIKKGDSNGKSRDK